MKAKAKESAAIKKARQKVKSHIQAENKMITPKALEEMTNTIHRWLQRHSSERINLKDKNIETFDENKHPAYASSLYVLRLKKLLQHNKKPSSKALIGRVKASKR